MFNKTIIFAILIFFQSSISSYADEDVQESIKKIESAYQLAQQHENSEDILFSDPLWNSDQAFNAVNDYFSSDHRPNFDVLFKPENSITDDLNLQSEAHEIPFAYDVPDKKPDNISMNDQDTPMNYDSPNDDPLEFELYSDIFGLPISSSNFDLNNAHDQFALTYGEREAIMDDPSDGEMFSPDYENEYDYNYDPNSLHDIVSDKYDIANNFVNGQNMIFDTSRIPQKSDDFVRDYLYNSHSNSKNTYNPDSENTFPNWETDPFLGFGMKLDNIGIDNSDNDYIDSFLGSVENKFNPDLDFSRDYLQPSQGINSNALIPVIINFDGEIIQRPTQELASSGKDSDKMDLELIKLLEATLSDSNSQFSNEVDNVDETQKPGMFVYQKLTIHLEQDSLPEVSDFDGKGELGVNLDSKYISLMEDKSNNNMAMLRFIGPVFMALGLLVTLSVILIAVKKNEHSCRKIKQEDKLSGGLSYHIIQEV